MRRAWFVAAVVSLVGCTQDFGVFEPSGGSGGSGNQGGGGSGNTGGGGSGNMGGGGSTGCMTEMDCPDPGTCQSATCIMGSCGAAQDVIGTACGNMNMQLCDMAGMCVDCLTVNDCPDPQNQICQNGTCAGAGCGDGMQNGGETDTDCGGPDCGPCMNGDSCNDGGDCLSGFCSTMGGGTCAPCGGSADCPADQYCSNLVCLDDKVQGNGCAAPEECPGDTCVDGVCCESACGASCESCTNLLTGQPDGTCAPTSQGVDPDDDCAASGCNLGTCDGTGQCDLQPQGTKCGDFVCANGVQSNPACDANGNCNQTTMTDCMGHACSGIQCDTMCAGDGECLGAFHCNAVTGGCDPDAMAGDPCPTGNECAATLNCVGVVCVAPQGAPCGGNGAFAGCATGFCVDGVCCESLCNQVCKACSAAKSTSADGVCGNVDAGTDPDNDCPGGNTCNGNGAC